MREPGFHLFKLLLGLCRVSRLFQSNGILYMSLAAGKLRQHIDLPCQRQHPRILPLIVIGDDKLHDHMLILLERTRKTGFIDLNGAVRMPRGEISIRQHDTVIKSIGEFEIIFQPSYPRVMADKHPRNPILQIHPLVAGKDLRKQVREAAYTRHENDHPYPIVLRAFTYAMNSTYYLQANADIIKIMVLKKH